MGLQLLVDNFIHFSLLLLSVFKNVCGLIAGYCITSFLNNLIEHFLLFLLNFKGLHFLILFSTYHLFLHGTFIIFFFHSLPINQFQSGSSIEDLFHFGLKIEVLVAFDGFIVFDSISVQFYQVPDHLFRRIVRKFKLNLIV